MKKIEDIGLRALKTFTQTKIVGVSVLLVVMLCCFLIF